MLMINQVITKDNDIYVNSFFMLTTQKKNRIRLNPIVYMLINTIILEF